MCDFLEVLTSLDPTEYLKNKIIRLNVCTQYRRTPQQSESFLTSRSYLVDNRRNNIIGYGYLEMLSIYRYRPDLPHTSMCSEIHDFNHFISYFVILLIRVDT